MEQVQSAAEVGAELAARLARVGNFSALDHAREQLFYAQTTAELARARHTATAAREALTRLFGFAGLENAYTLPQRLPDLPASPNAPEQIESLALNRRLDLLIARSESEAGRPRI